jgi:microcystin-dependent protein
MAQQTIDVGTGLGSGDGDHVRVAFQKTNANFTELYNSDASIAARVGALEVTPVPATNIPVTGGALLLGTMHLGQALDIVDHLEAADVPLDTATFTNNLGVGVDTVQKLADWIDNTDFAALSTGPVLPSAVGSTVSIDTTAFTVLAPTDNDCQKVADRVDNLFAGLSATYATDADLATETAARIAGDISSSAAAATVQTNLNAETTNRINADTALSTRISTLEGLQATNATDAEVTAAIALEANSRALGDNGLDVRLSALEADPTTKAYVDTQTAALDARLDTLEADDTTKAYVDAQDAALDARLDIVEPEVAALRALSGTAVSAADLGTFAGSTIPDAQTTKQALQALETAVEAVSGISLWVAGTSYGAGKVVRDPFINVLFVALNAQASSTVRPSEDPINWLGADADLIGEIAVKAVARDHGGYKKIKAGTPALSRTKYVRLLNAICPAVTVSATNGSVTIGTDAADADLFVVGMPVEGPGVQPGTTIATVPVAAQTKTGYVVSGSNTIYAEVGQSPQTITSGEVDGQDLPTDSTVTASVADLPLTTFNVAASSTFADRDPTAAVNSVPLTSRRVQAPAIGFATVTDHQLAGTATRATATNGSSLVWFTNQYPESRIRTNQRVRVGASPQTMTVASVARAVDTLTTSVNVISGAANLNLEVGEYDAAKWPINRRFNHALLAGVANLDGGYISSVVAESTHTASTLVGDPRLFLNVGDAGPAGGVGRFVAGIPAIPALTTYTASTASTTHPGASTDSVSNTINWGIGNDPTSGPMIVGRRITYTGGVTNGQIAAYNPAASISCSYRTGAPNLGLEPASTAVFSSGRILNNSGFSSRTLVSEIVAADFTRSCGTTSGTAVVTTADTSNLYVGQRVSGAGIAANAVIVSIVGGVSFTLSATSTATAAAVTLTFGRVWTASAPATANGAGTSTSYGAYVVVSPATPVTTQPYASSIPTVGRVLTLDAAATATASGNVTFGAQMGYTSVAANTVTSKLVGGVLGVGLNMTSNYTAGSTNYTTAATFAEWITVSTAATVVGSNQTFTFGGSWTLDRPASATSGPNVYSFGGVCTLSLPFVGATSGAAQVRLMPYGGGDGSTTFNIPSVNLAGRVMAFMGPGHAPGSLAGSDTHLLTSSESGMPSHTHGVTDPVHNHAVPHGVATFNGSNNGGEWFLHNGGITLNSNTSVNFGASGSTSGVTVNASSSFNAATAHNNIQPTAYIGVAGFIYAGAAA